MPTARPAETRLAGLCQDYISYLGTRITPEALAAAGVKLIIIGCGDASLIKPYRELLSTPFPIYADLSKKTCMSFFRCCVMGPLERKG